MSDQPPYDLTISPPAYSFERVLEMKAKESQPDIRELLDFLERDPVTTAHLLRQVNSPAYSLRQNVASFERAVTMLGFDATCNTVLTEWYSEKNDGVYTEAARNAYSYIVRTSIVSGAIAKEVAQKMRINDAAVLVTCALLHQLGRLALLASDPVTYSGLWNSATSPSGETISIPPGIGRELVHYRTDYTRLGAEIARQWELPAELRESMRYHSDPDKCEESDRRTMMAVAVSQLAARSLFEPPSALDRDQSVSRVEKAYGETARACGMMVAELEDYLSDVKFTALEKARDLNLHPEQKPR